MCQRNGKLQTGNMKEPSAVLGVPIERKKAEIHSKHGQLLDFISQAPLCSCCQEAGDM